MQVAWTVLCILNGGIFFKEFEDLPDNGKVIFPIGLLIVLSGMGLLIPKPKAPGAPSSARKGLAATGSGLPQEAGAAAAAASEAGSVPPSPASSAAPSPLPLQGTGGLARAVTFSGAPGSRGDKRE